MKRINDVFCKIIDIENLISAHRNARKDKSFYTEVKMVDSDPLKYAEKIKKMLSDKEYEISKYEIFEKQCDNKIRLIYKLPYFPDRIIQWAIMLQIQERLDKNLIEQTYSAIPGRGIHKALSNVKSALENDKDGTKYCLKLDVKKFYPNINQDILMLKLNKLIKCKETLELISQIVHSLPENEGVPIGSYLSQYFGNYYLSDLDHYIKEELGCRHYHRYMDDMILMSENKEILWEWFYKIKKKLSDDKLEIKKDYKVFPVDVQGLDFVGYRFFRNRVIARKSIYKKLKKRINFLRKVKRTKNQECSFQSYNGWLKWTTCSNLKSKMEE